MPKIAYVQYNNPALYPSLGHSSRLLANRGWEVLFLGMEVLESDPFRFSPHPRIAVQRLTFCPSGWRQKLHYLWFCLWTAARILFWRPRWIYASDPASALSVLLARPLSGAKLIYHEHDFPGPGGSFFMRFILRARRRLAHQARICIVPNERRSERFSEEMGFQEKVFCVWNCPSREEVAPPRTPAVKGELRVWYHGSLGPGRLPGAVLEALARLPGGVRLGVAGYETVGDPEYGRYLREMALRLRIADRMELIGRIPVRQDLLAECRRWDVGLSLMPRRTSDLNERDMVLASNKPFEYLACGLALLVSDLPDWRTTYVEPGYGLACDPDDPESIARALRQLLDYPDQMRAMGERGRQKILSEWNYERQFLAVLERLDSKDV